MSVAISILPNEVYSPQISEESRAEIIHLNQDTDVSKLQMTINMLTEELSAAKAEIKRLRTSPASESSSWANFITTGTGRFGKSKGFQQAFIEAYPQYCQTDLSNWRRLDYVPAEARECARRFVPQTVPTERGRDWSEIEHAKFDEIMKKTPKIRMMPLAETLTKEFGRIITEGAAKAAKHRWKLKNS